MAREIFINGGIFETRLALCDDQHLLEIHHLALGSAHDFYAPAEDTGSTDKSLEGRIYLGRVVHVAKQMGAAFVDIGEAVNGFLPISAAAQNPAAPGGRLPHEGEAIAVQVIREAFGAKGPRLSARIDPVLAARISGNGEKPPRLLHAGAGALCTALLKMAGDERVERIVIDHAAAYALVKRRGPDWVAKSLQRAMPGDLFATAGIEDQIEAARHLSRPLPGGGSLIIEPTSAFTAIDVNAGSMLAGNLREKVNLEAARAIPHELRLRGIGGQIVIDFLALKNMAGWRRIIGTLKRGLAADPALTRVEKISRGGLLAITRERRFAPLTPPRAPRDPPRPASGIAHEILRELQRSARHRAGRKLRVRASPAVIKWLKKQTGLDKALERELGIIPSWLPLDGTGNTYYEIFEDS